MNPHPTETTTRVILFNTGTDTQLLNEMEDGFRRCLEPLFPLEIHRLGHVENLAEAYFRTALAVPDPDTVLFFCHQDVRPLNDGELRRLTRAKNLPAWLANAMLDRDYWARALLELIHRKGTGLLGVAGSPGLVGGVPWWSYPDLSGAVVHSTPEKPFQLNPYGPYGRVAVLDGLCLIATQRSWAAFGEPSPMQTGFHFYDMDISLRSLAAGLKNWTIPLLLKHRSAGKRQDDPQWLEDLVMFQLTWGEALPLHVPFQHLRID